MNYCIKLLVCNTLRNKKNYKKIKTNHIWLSIRVTKTVLIYANC